MLGRMNGRDGMRAADADRQAVADRLRAAVAEGLAVPIRGAYWPPRAGADASALAVPDPAVPAPADLSGRPVTARWLVEVWRHYLKVVAIVLVVWAVVSVLSGEAVYFWPGWVAGPWGAVLLVRTVGGITSGEPRRRAVEEPRRQRRREKRARKRERKATKRALGDS